MESISVDEAKAHLPRLLDRVAHGEEIRITRDGRPVARLVPEANSAPADIQAAIDEIKEFRRGRTLGGVATVRELIEEGRRY